MAQTAHLRRDLLHSGKVKKVTARVGIFYATNFLQSTQQKERQAGRIPDNSDVILNGRGGEQRKC
jgi:hypothetical protein